MGRKGVSVGLGDTRRRAVEMGKGKVSRGSITGRFSYSVHVGVAGMRP